MMKLSQLAQALGVELQGADSDIAGIALDSRQVRPGDLFVALHGSRTDGLGFVADAVRRGAVAVCARAPVAALPTLVVPDPRATVPHLAAVFYGHPARALRLIGITGTLGKTSTALLIQSALAASGHKVGVIGSLGVRVDGTVADTGMTTPDAPAIHAALRLMVDSGVETAAIEVTSHAIALRRVGGLRFALGVLTNLVPDEHLDFHGTPEHYLRTKARFFEMLEDDAPLVINQDDELVRSLVGRALRRRLRPVIGVSLAGSPEAAVTAVSLRSDAAGSAFGLRIATALPCLGGGVIEPCTVPLVLPVFGVHQVANAALAATAALLAGAWPTGVTEAVADLEPIHRRMELVRHGSPAILDDTVGNPRTLHGVFHSIRSIPHARLRIAFGIRGARGPAINRRLARTLAELVAGHPATAPARLVVTASVDTAGPRDQVSDEERDAVLETLTGAGVTFEFEPTLAAAVRRVLEGWAPDDLILLLGAQGMDQASRIAQSLLADLPPRPRPILLDQASAAVALRVPRPGRWIA